MRNIIIPRSRRLSTAVDEVSLLGWGRCDVERRTEEVFGEGKYLLASVWKWFTV